MCIPYCELEQRIKENTTGGKQQQQKTTWQKQVLTDLGTHHAD